MPAVVLQYYTAVGAWWPARESEGQRAMPARHALALPAVAQAHPHDLPTWVLGSTAACLASRHHHAWNGRLRWSCLLSLTRRLPRETWSLHASASAYMHCLAACYSSTSSVICTVLMAWHWQVLDARRWRMERRRRSARSGSNQTGQACSSTSTHGTEVRNKQRKKNP